MIRFVRAALAAAVAFTLVFAPPPRAQAQQKPVVIGTAVSLTGIFADGGHYTLEGYQLWAKHQNAKGGLLGRPVEIKYYDDQSDGATAVRLYERLINEDKVDAIVGPYGTALSVPASAVAERYNMPMICPETADVQMFRRGFKNIFQGLGPVQTYLYGMLSIAHDRGYKKLAVVGGDTAFPHALTNAVPEIARGFGQSVVYQEFYPGNASDLSSVVQKLRAANPDVLLAMAFPTDSVALLRNMKQANWSPPIVYEAIGPSDPLFEKNVGKDGDGVFTVTAWNDANPTAENKAFITAYRNEFHKAAEYHGAASYAALQVLAAAATKAGGFDKDKLRSALATITLPTLLGTWRVDPRTGIQLGYTSYIEQWQNGKQVVVYPRSAAQAKPPKIPFAAWNTR